MQILEPVEVIQEQHEMQPLRESPAVTLRAIAIGLLLSGALAGFNAWIETAFNVHFLGGVQMPFGAIFGLAFLVLVVNWPLRKLRQAVPGIDGVPPPFSAEELLTVYSMLLFAALISTPGTENFFLTTGATLFYFSTRENGWANTFYQYVPDHLAPGWNGRTFQREVIDPLYTGGLSLSEIPWHAWTLVLSSWGIFLLLVYGCLFFFALMLRRQWIVNEALSFPLVQLPLQMVETDDGQRPPGPAFWANKTMWAGCGLALGLHLLRGLNNYYPDWPVIAAFQGNPLTVEFTEKPWSVMGAFKLEFFLGAIGIAYLLTREVSFSFWSFVLLFKIQLVLAEQLGFAPTTLPKDTATSQPMFIAFQSIGGWGMMAGLLLWTARGHVMDILHAAWRGEQRSDEPFSPRMVVGGLVFTLAALLCWCSFAGIGLMVAGTFLGIYLLSSIVLARLVVEGGLLFPKVTFSGIELMTAGLFGTPAMGAANLTRLSFLQPVLLGDTRTNVLPGFLHTLKIAHELKLDTRSVRRLMMGVSGAIVVSLAVTLGVLIATLYSAGGLSGYTFFSYKGPQTGWTGLQSSLSSNVGVEVGNLTWMGVGALVVYGLTMARSRVLWFPLHPLGYIVASSYSLGRLWPSFFAGWLLKTMLQRFGGHDAVSKLRPFMLGLVLGNVGGMVLWMLFGFWFGTQIPFWPA